MKRLLNIISTLGILFVSGGGFSMLSGTILPGAAVMISGTILVGAALISFAILRTKEI